MRCEGERKLTERKGEKEREKGGYGSPNNRKLGQVWMNKKKI